MLPRPRGRGLLPGDLVLEQGRALRPLAQGCGSEPRWEPWTPPAAASLGPLLDALHVEGALGAPTAWKRALWPGGELGAACAARWEPGALKVVEVLRVVAIDVEVARGQEGMVAQRLSNNGWAPGPATGLWRRRLEARGAQVVAARTAPTEADLDLR